MRCFLFLLLLTFAGCSTIDSRIKERPEAFERLSEKQKAIVLQGDIDEGMNIDAVYIAWGRPDNVGRGRERGKSVEEWIYEGTGTEFVSSYRAVPVLYSRHGRYYRSWDYAFDPVLVSYQYPYKTVLFENGKTVGWRLLPRQ